MPRFRITTKRMTNTNGVSIEPGMWTKSDMTQYQTTTNHVTEGAGIYPSIYECPTVQVIELKPTHVLLSSPDNGEMGNGGFLDE